MLGLQLGTSLQGLGALGAAFFADKEVNHEAAALSPTVGWLMLLGATAVVGYFIIHSDRFRRFWLEREDPRSIGLYRIVFGFFVLANMNDFYEYFTFLFTDEGIFTADVARHVHARAQFKGFGDGFTDEEPWGFFDMRAVWEFAKGHKYSLLYFWDSPTFFWWHMGAFYVSCAAFIVGFRTRVAGVLTFFLMNSIFFRNHLFWEGTELVYRVFLAYLICAKSGYAYSVDNWLRCRKLDRAGRLSKPGGPGEGAGVPPDDEDHPEGLAAIYRMIPAWPRRLMMIQLGYVYAATGILKNGSVWAKGDAIYYAWNMDHFYRFHPQQITAALGTNVLRLATWFTHWGEAFFAVTLLGVIYWWRKSQGFPPVTGLRKLGARACLATVLGVCAALIWVTWPVHFAPNFFPKGADPEGLTSRWIFVTGFVVILLGLYALWQRLGRKPLFTIRKLPKLGTLAKPIEVDQDFVMRWVFGRRLWIPWHISVMGGIFILMNIGQFQTAMLSNTIIFFTGVEVAKFGRFLARNAGRVIPKSTGARIALIWFLWLPALILKVASPSAKRGDPIVPPESPEMPHHKRDAARFPRWAMVATALFLLVGVLVKVRGVTESNVLDKLVKDGLERSQAELQVNMSLINMGEQWNLVWIGAALFAAGVAFQRWRIARKETLPIEDPESGIVRAPWAYGPFGRFLVGGILMWQLTAIPVWLTPDKASLKNWRGNARKVFSKWLTITQTDQGWGMFAPNPPRSNVFLKVVVYDAEGEPWDMKTDVYAKERKPIPWIWNDRMRKMNRRIIGGESGNTEWYRKWYARWHCRQWALENNGDTPDKVELIKLWYKIPPPEQTFPNKWYSPEKLLERTGHEEVKHTEHCRRTVMGQLRDEVRERHGLPPLPEDLKYKRWIKHKRRDWEKKLAKERGEEPPKPAIPKQPVQDLILEPLDRMGITCGSHVGLST
ncbi:MAG: hypothetical protein AAF637_21210 [Pseudomonadota bacterium]